MCACMGALLFLQRSTGTDSILGQIHAWKRSFSHQKSLALFILSLRLKTTIQTISLWLYSTATCSIPDKDEDTQSLPPSYFPPSLSLFWAFTFIKSTFASYSSRSWPAPLNPIYSCDSKKKEEKKTKHTWRRLIFCDSFIPVCGIAQPLSAILIPSVIMLVCGPGSAVGDPETGEDARNSWQPLTHKSDLDRNII